jgi:hypothetical protein
MLAPRPRHSDRIQLTTPPPGPRLARSPNAPTPEPSAPRLKPVAKRRRGPLPHPRRRIVCRPRRSRANPVSDGCRGRVSHCSPVSAGYRNDATGRAIAAASRPATTHLAGRTSPSGPHRRCRWHRALTRVPPVALTSSAALSPEVVKAVSSPLKPAVSSPLALPIDPAPSVSLVRRTGTPEPRVWVARPGAAPLDRSRKTSRSPRPPRSVPGRNLSAARGEP